jgi:hypothetical protein
MVHIPERRKGKERRVGSERRKTPRGIRTIHGINRKSTVKNVF